MDRVKPVIALPPPGWFSVPEIDDEVLVAFLHEGFEPLCLEVLESQMHQGAGIMGGQRAFILIRPNARHRIGGRPKWGDVVLKATADDTDLSPVERAWLSGLDEPPPAVWRPRGPDSITFGDSALPYASAPLTIRLGEAGSHDGAYVLTTVRHAGRSPDGLARLLAGEGLVRRR